MGKRMAKGQSEKWSKINVNDVASNDSYECVACRDQPRGSNNLLVLQPKTPLKPWFLGFGTTLRPKLLGLSPSFTISQTHRKIEGEKRVLMRNNAYSLRSCLRPTCNFLAFGCLLEAYYFKPFSWTWMAKFSTMLSGVMLNLGVPIGKARYIMVDFTGIQLNQRLTKLLFTPDLSYWPSLISFGAHTLIFVLAIT
jgi:hypothetical protein